MSFIDMKIEQVREIIDKAIDVHIDESDINGRVQKIITKANEITDINKYFILSRGLTLIDLTSLKGDESFEDIKNLCIQAENAVDSDREGYHALKTAAVCVFPANACHAIQALKDLDVRNEIKVASVAGDFPAAQLPLNDRIEEIKEVVNYGVDEVDIVINRKLALANQWFELYEELCKIRTACGKTTMKTILATGDLKSLKSVYIASIVAMLAGSDFIKTSTGKEIINATLPVGIVMSKAILDFYNISKRKVGIKAAGGIKTTENALQWMTLVEEELGEDWCSKELFRIGASSLRDNIITSMREMKNNS